MLRTFLRDMLTYLPTKLLPALTGFITAPILTRLLLPAEYGNYILALGASEFLFALACSGLASVPVRFFPAYKAKSELGTFFVSLGLSASTVIAAVSMVSLSALLLLRRHLPAALYPLLVMSVAIFIVQAVFVISMEVVRAHERSGLYTVIELLTRYGILAVGLLLIMVFAFRVRGLLWGELLAPALALPVLLFSTTRGVGIRRQHFRPPDAVQMWRYAWPLALGNVAMWVLRLSDRYIISFFRPESEVGVYSAAYNISAKSIDMLVALFLLSMGPMVMNTWETKGREATEETIAMITRLFLILCLPAAAGLGLLARPLVALLTGEAYHKGYQIVAYVAFSSFAWGLSQIASRSLLIKKKTRRIATNQIVAGLVNLGLNLVLVPRFGFVAAGFSTFVGYAVLFALQVNASRRYLVWRFPFTTLRNVVVATICMGLVLAGVHAVSGNEGSGVDVGYLFASIVVAVAAYFASVLLLGEANQEEMDAVKRWLKGLAGKSA